MVQRSCCFFSGLIIYDDVRGLVTICKEDILSSLIRHHVLFDGIQDSKESQNQVLGLANRADCFR